MVGGTPVAPSQADTRQTLVLTLNPDRADATRPQTRLRQRRCDDPQPPLGKTGEGALPAAGLAIHRRRSETGRPARSRPAAPSGRTLLPVLLSERRRQRPGRSTSAHCKVSISPRLHPVSASKRMAVTACQVRHQPLQPQALGPKAGTGCLTGGPQPRIRCSVTPRTGLVMMMPSLIAR